MISIWSSACSIPPYSSTPRSSIATNRVRERADVHTALALAYLDQGQAEAGRIEAQRALEWIPEHRDALHALALAALAQDNISTARKYFERVFNNGNGSLDDMALRLNYARFLCEHDDLSAGRALLQKAPEQSVENKLHIQRLLDRECAK